MTGLTTAPTFTAARRWACLGVLSASLLVVTMDLTILNVALPALSADLQPSSTELLWIVDVYSLVLAGLLIPMSALADRWGRRRMLLAGFTVFAVASLLVLAADTAGHVIAVRALLGLGGAMIMPTTLSMIRSVFDDPAERATALGVWAGISGLGAGLGPLVGGALLDRFDWQAAFLVNVPLMVLAIVAGLLILPESRDPNPGAWDVVGTGLSIAGMVALVWSIKSFAKAQSLTDGFAWTLLITAAVLLTWFVRRCLRREEPLLDVRLFRRRPFTAGVIAALTAMLAIAALLLLVAQWLQLVEGDTPMQAGVRLLPIAGGGVVASLAAPWLAARIGARIVLAAGLAAAGIGALLIPLVPGDLTYPTVAVAMGLVGAGAGSLAIASAMIMAGTPTAKAGNAAAIEETAYDLGNVLGVALLGSVAAVIYRDHLDADALVARGLPVELADAAEDSLGAATGIAAEIGVPELADRAGRAFTDAFTDTSLIAGILMLTISVAVYLTAPKGLDISQQAH